MTTHRWPTFAVMGAGAVGSYFGGLLAKAGAPVTLIGRGAHAAAINAHGLRIESESGVETVPVPAATAPSAVSGARYVLFCVKSAATEEAASLIAPHLSADAIVLSMQNGVENPGRLRARMRNTVIPTLVYAAVNMPAAGHVSNTGGKRLVVGGAPRDMLEAVAAEFSAANISIAVSDNIDAALWTKLMMNCAYNAVSAIAEASYAQMTASHDMREVMRAAADEVIAVAAAKNIAIDRAVVERLFDLGKVMGRTFSSTAQDMMKGRPTEIDDLNGYVAREGGALGIATPVNATLAALVKLREQQRGFAK